MHVVCSHIIICKVFATNGISTPFGLSVGDYMLNSLFVLQPMYTLLIQILLLCGILCPICCYFYRLYEINTLGLQSFITIRNIKIKSVIIIVVITSIISCIGLYILLCFDYLFITALLFTYIILFPLIVLSKINFKTLIVFLTISTIGVFWNISSRFEHNSALEDYGIECITLKNQERIADFNSNKYVIYLGYENVFINNANKIQMIPVDEISEISLNPKKPKDKS